MELSVFGVNRLGMNLYYLHIEARKINCDTFFFFTYSVHEFIKRTRNVNVMSHL
jgi:hypothetical protein